MSLKRVTESKYREMEPIFPAEINDLNRRFGQADQNKMDMEEVCRRLTLLGYRTRSLGQFVKGSDGYSWYWMIEIETVQGRIWVAFPFATDKSRQDGVANDRSVALYTKILMNQTILDLIVSTLDRVIKWVSDQH
jgi:hypothetical protein